MGVAILRDIHGNGVRIDRVECWEDDGEGGVSVYTSSGAWVDLDIRPLEFVEALHKGIQWLAEDE